jgi:23S rRNA (cytidine1920-2'-O)/16S rRNA (cytidine1409-2'-O)-methyltransferase
MDEKFRHHPQVSLYEQTNILDVTIPNHDIALIDVSFTSIKPIIKHIASLNQEALCLIKPQFEAGHISFKQGVLKDLKMHKHILKDILDEVMSLYYYVYGLKKSDLKGKQGNQEYLLYIKKKANHANIDHMIGSVL